LKTTTYIVTTTDANGCVNRDTVTIHVDDILTLYVPSAFTPFNYNVKNNIFYAYGTGIWQFEFYIFDRWGALVFETNDPLIGWDGTYKGQMAVQDTYVWIAKASSITGKSISKTGAVTVVR
jgi:gliding motility-associated-like protein